MSALKDFVAYMKSTAPAMSDGSGADSGLAVSAQSISEELASDDAYPAGSADQRPREPRPLAMTPARDTSQRAAFLFPPLSP